MYRDQASCRACETALPRGAQSCPACGSDLVCHDRRRRWLGGLGTALTLSLVFAPIGLPLLWRAHRHRLASEGLPARSADRSLGAQLRSTLRDFLGLDRPPEPPTGGRRERRSSVGEARDLGGR